MGGNASQPVDLPALPQQRIVNVRDGQADWKPEIEDIMRYYDGLLWFIMVYYGLFWDIPSFLRIFQVFVGYAEFFAIISHTIR